MHKRGKDQMFWSSFAITIVVFQLVSFIIEPYLYIYF